MNSYCFYFRIQYNLKENSLKISWHIINWYNWGIIWIFYWGLFCGILDSPHKNQVFDCSKNPSKLLLLTCSFNSFTYIFSFWSYNIIILFLLSIVYSKPSHVFSHPIQVHGIFLFNYIYVCMCIYTRVCMYFSHIIWIASRTFLRDSVSYQTPLFCSSGPYNLPMLSSEMTLQP